MRTRLKVIFILMLAFQISVVNAGSEAKSDCRPADLGATAGAGAGGAVGAVAGTMVGAKISAGGCALTGWATLGIGCVVSVAVGIVVGTVIGARSGEKAGELVCDGNKK